MSTNLRIGFSCVLALGVAACGASTSDVYTPQPEAPASCSCLPEHYTVSLQTATGATLRLTPTLLEADNASCSALTATSTEGCGTTLFGVP